MSKEQQQQLDATLRQGQFDTGADVQTLRAAFNEFMARVPVAPDIHQNPVEIAGVAGIEVTIDGVEPEHVVLYLHGGVYVIGSAAASVPVAGDLARRTGARVITLDYRLAPEHPYPAAVEDARAAYEGLLAQGIVPGQIALAGESAGGGLAVATLLALRDAGTPLPSCVFVMSPYVDLTLSGETLTERQELDPLLSPDGLRARVPDYVAQADAADPSISPIFADLTDLPPLLIQAGSHEVLLSDALRLADRAALCDVAVTLEVTPGVPHVFQSFAGFLDEAGAALDRAAEFLQTHLAQAASVPLDWNATTIAEFRANEGRVGGVFEGTPLVLVHNRGRKSGREFVDPVMYLPHPTDPDVMYIFATKGGAPTNPDWYYNLTAAREGAVERGTETYKVVVRELTGAERDLVYAEQAQRFPGFADYARETAGVRTIPVLELTRA